MEAFTVLGGVPSVHIRYDNLKPAVKQVLFGRSRLESARWASFKSWYQFSAFYCAPGEDGAHEKGGWSTRAGGSAASTWSRRRRWSRWRS
ncbi:hypothetical protein ACIRYZ_36410 [Kitasatospora sp. NPDC101155]|uniref:hypothetical protein n=1 Tax=Kitasatospora sp. NPDC101155 TaxID=3364097 RepID=UPI00382AD5BE